MSATQGCIFLGNVSRIRFGKGGGDLGAPAGLLRSHGHESDASRSAPAFCPSLPCFPESRLRGKPNSIHSGHAHAEHNGYWLFFVLAPLSIFRHLVSGVRRPCFAKASVFAKASPFAKAMGDTSPDTSPDTLQGKLASGISRPSSCPLQPACDGDCRGGGRGFYRPEPVGDQWRCQCHDE